MNKKKQRIQKLQEQQDEEFRINDQMPAWMRQFLALGGIDREFKIHELTLEQRNVVDFACHLKEMQKHGLIEIVFDPKTNQDPLVVPTKKGLRIYG